MNFYRHRTTTDTKPRRRTKTMCRTTVPERRRDAASSKANQSSGPRSQGFLGMLRRPSWGLGLGLGARGRRIQDPGLRQSVLPRRHACLDLSSTTEATDSLGKGSDHSQQNQKWETSSGGQPKKTTTLKFLQELQNEPLRTREEISESQKWKDLDDLVDMAYKIRVTREFDWEKLLEEDEEEDLEQSSEPNELSPTFEKSTFEKPRIHLQRCIEGNGPTIGPGVLIT